MVKLLSGYSTTMTKLYTLLEAQAEIAKRACSVQGHDFTLQIVMGKELPQEIHCNRCHREWLLHPEEIIDP